MLNLCLVPWMSSQDPSEAGPAARRASGRRVDLDRDVLLVFVAPRKGVLEERCARTGGPAAASTSLQALSWTAVRRLFP